VSPPASGRTPTFPLSGLTSRQACDPLGYGHPSLPAARANPTSASGLRGVAFQPAFPAHRLTS